jgi:hypothetical protein
MERKLKRRGWKMLKSLPESARPPGTQHGETEGTLRGRSATFQELDSAQTSSCEDARRRARKGPRTHKAVADLSHLRHGRCRLRPGLAG